MLKSKFLFLLSGFLFLLPLLSEAQQLCMVYFKDKQHNEFNPYSYFDAKALERRIHNGLPLDDPSDWPVNEAYMNEVSLMVNEVIIESRWLNAMAVDADDLQINTLRQLPYVLNVEWIEPSEMNMAGYDDYDTSVNTNEAKILEGQLKTLGVDAWQKAGIDGKGLRIAILDVGFDHADKVPAFDHIRNENRLIATHDFTNRKNGEYVYYGNGHGTQVWSCIAGKIGDIQIGLATGAEFLLAKTEKSSEKYSEELYWLAAAEWADKNGADIINSSLGYTGKRYFNWQMDGKTSFVTRAANIAARKGMLVVNAAGNEGSDSWHYVGAPADADSVLSIGGIDPETGYHTSFSSYGPTSDKRMKPNVSAYGHVIAAAPAGLTSTQGTSFASPLVAGFAACAWQTNRSLTNMQLFKEIEKSGSLYPYFDYAHGFGIPQAGHFLNKDEVSTTPTFTVVENEDSIRIVVNKNLSDKNGASQNPEFKAVKGVTTESSGKQEYLYYNIMNKSGVLDSYYVLDVTQPEVVSILRSDFHDGETLNVHFEGYSISVKL
ncbi:MAG: S8 family serine peptidase [Bacteroidales bacterium]|nr:S8 family serine peptidase [Bacteroidales bacterium]